MQHLQQAAAATHTHTLYLTVMFVNALNFYEWKKKNFCRVKSVIMWGNLSLKLMVCVCVKKKSKQKHSLPKKKPLSNKNEDWDTKN